MNCKYNVSQEGILEKLRTTLEKIDPDVWYGDWIKALMVIFYETSGSDEGLALANDWSSRGAKYRGVREIDYYWSRFSLAHKKPVRMGTLMWIAKGQ